MALQQLSQDFLAAFESRRYNDAASLIPKIKLEYAKIGLLTPSLQFDKADLLAARQLLEMAVLVSIFAQKPQAETERLLLELRPFYSPELRLQSSENHSKMTALYLLIVLTSNRVSEFHTELETIENAESDKYLRYPVSLERWLMEGAYDKAWKAVTDDAQFPAPEFALLMKSEESNLELTIRNEIAICMGSAYPSLPAASAKHLLYITSDAELEKFVESRTGWNLLQQRVTFDGNVSSHPTQALREKKARARTYDEEQLIDKMLGYAAQIEVII